MLNSFPLIEHIPFVDPIQVFPAFNDQRYPFFLDSGVNVVASILPDQYSFIGFDPFLVFKSKGENIEIWRGNTSGTGVIPERHRGDPFTILRQTIDQYNLPVLPHLPSFLGGGVGYFSYEMRGLVEKLPAKASDDLNIPDCIVCLYDVILIFDLKQRQAYIASSGFPEQEDHLRYIRAVGRIEWVREQLQIMEHAKDDCPNKGDCPVAPTVVLPHTAITSNLTREEYIQMVTKAKEYIASGDIYQVNLAQRLTSNISVPPLELYQRLRKINPAPFGAYLDFGEIVIASSSPERFLLCQGSSPSDSVSLFEKSTSHQSTSAPERSSLSDSVSLFEGSYEAAPLAEGAPLAVETRPIKGTRPRGKDEAEDERLKQELLLSEKDKAELIMIVDLLRNDLGRVCRYGSVTVKDIRRIETYPTVFHTVATICGELSSRNDRFDLLRACFPGGSITGAPKIRAMEIIDELEPDKRHIYTGSIGYLSFTGSMDLNIAIRTFLIKNNRVYFYVGGGIVADSSPEEEYLETLHKAKALIEAVETLHCNVSTPYVYQPI